jgi:hypothetical protein
MATQSVQKDRQGPDWPLGFIEVVTPGTPVSIMSLVDPTSVNAPESPTSTTSNEYTVAAQQILFMGYTPFGTATGHGLTFNIGNVYIMRRGVQGLGNRDDYGSLVKVLAPGETFYLASAALVRNVYSPYRYYIDADNTTDGAIVTLIMQ